MGLEKGSFITRLVTSLRSYFSLEGNAQLLILSQSLVTFSIGVEEVMLSIYLSKIGYSEAEIGVIVATVGFVLTLLLIPAAYLADAIGRKIPAAVGLLLGALSFAGYTINLGFWYMILVAGIGGVGSALYAATSTALLADVAPDTNRRNMVFSLAASATSVFGALGALAGGLPTYLRAAGFEEILSYVATLLVASLVMAFSALMLSVARIPTAVQANGARRSLLVPFRSQRSRAALFKSLVYIVIFYVGAGMVSRPLLSLWFSRKYQAEESLIGLVYTISFIVLSLSALAAPALAKRLGPVRFAALGQGLSIAPLVLMAVSNSFIAAGALSVIRTAMAATPNPVIRSLMISLVDPSERAMISSIWSLTNQFTISGSQILGGYLMSKASLDAPLYATAIAYVASTTAFYVLFKQYEDEKRQA